MEAANEATTIIVLRLMVSQRLVVELVVWPRLEGYLIFHD